MTHEHIIDELQRRIGFIILELSDSGKIRACSSNFPEFLKYTGSSISKLNAANIFSQETYEDLFGKNSNSLRERDVHNYRGYMLDAMGAKVFIQISGYYRTELDAPSGSFRLLIQKLSFEKPAVQNTGHFRDNLKAHELVNRYIPPALYEKARLTARAGLASIPDEVRYLTFLFADLVSFTKFAEEKDPAEVMEILNLSIGVASATILRWNGVVDKIMGDSIMAIFENPLDAMISAVEIQKQFRFFNEMRFLQNLEPLELRIGINSGSCIHGSIGMEKNMEWTVIGDAVNSASRLEKNCRVGGILASEETVRHFKNQIHITEEMDVSLRGKKNNLKAFYIDRVSFAGMGDEVIDIGIDDEINV